MIYDNLNNVNKSYDKRTDNYWTKMEEIDTTIEKLQKRTENKIKSLKDEKEKLTYPYIEIVAKPLLKEIKQKLKAECYEKYGAFGLNNETTFYFKKDKNKDITDKGNVLGTLCLINSEKGWAIRNEKKNSGKYPKGSIAEMNGMNSQEIEITNKMDLNWLLKFVKGQR